MGEPVWNGGVAVRDGNDGRVTFMGVAREFGLSLEQAKTLWRISHRPFPSE